MTDIKDTPAALSECPCCGAPCEVTKTPAWDHRWTDENGQPQRTHHHAIERFTYRSGQLVPVPSVEVVARFQIGDQVNITAPDWQNEPPHYITGIDWHPKHGITYTTSEVWPPKVGGFHVEGLTEGWRDEDLSPIAAMKGEVRGDA